MKKILLTGASGYIGKRLLPVLLMNEYEVYCTVRDISSFNSPHANHEKCHIIQVDFLKEKTLDTIPKDIDGAYFLMHSMSSSSEDFMQLETQIAQNFTNYLEKTNCEHIIYLSGIINDSSTISKHLNSREAVGNILAKSKCNTTILGAGIIVGSGSSSFEIMRDLVEKLPLMVAPRWLLTKSQYIGVRNVIEFLSKSLFNPVVYNKSYDIAGPNVMTYREMLLSFAQVRGLKRYIIQVPFLSPKLSSYWLYFVTATSFSLARSLVESMKVEIIAKPNDLDKLLIIKLLTFEESIKDAFAKVQQNDVASSWKDSVISGRLSKPVSSFIQVPIEGCFLDVRVKKINNIETTLNKIWSIGGTTGWYYGTWLWELRGFLDKLLGGVGLRRGRTNLSTIHTGDALDFWRVILADKKEKRLLLYAEMRLPGEAWLEFKINDNNELEQTATFRPVGILGRLYWYMVMPFHSLIFNGMAKKIAQ